jgi:hypothetical protein
MKKERLKKMAQNSNNIEGIYNYCDRWCERCTKTGRCLLYQMDQEDAKEYGPESESMDNEKFWQRIHDSFQLTLDMIRDDAKKFGIDIDNLPDDPELNQKIEDQHDAARNHPVTQFAEKYMHSSLDWMKESEAVFKEKMKALEQSLVMDIGGIDPEEELEMLEDCLSVIGWYQMQITVKLSRAFSSRFSEIEDAITGMEIENMLKDSDGSAKVALLGIDRSIGAWGGLLNLLETEEDFILSTLAHLEKLRRKVENAFPEARIFKRPGFDD